MNYSQKIECIDQVINQLLHDHPEFQEENSTGYDLLTGLYDIKTDILKQWYPVQDDTWLSRCWNEDMTDYIDLSGYSFANLIA